MLNILRIILYIILIILAILIIACLIIFFVPIKYKVYVDTNNLFEKPQNIDANCNVTWLFKIVQLNLIYKEQKSDLSLKLFGIKIKKRHKAKDEKQTSFKSIEDEEFFSDTCKQAEENNLDGIKPTDILKNQGQEEEKQKAQERKEEEKQKVQEKEEEQEKQKAQEKKEEQEKQKAQERKEEEKQKAQERKEEEEKQKAQKRKEERKRKQKEKKSKKDKSSFKENIEKVKKIKEQVKYYYNYEDKDIIIKKFKKLLKSLIKTFKPNDIFIKVLIGFDDPEMTGKIIGAFYALAGCFMLPMFLAGDFERKILNIKSNVRGKITIWFIFYPFIKFLLAKEIIKIIKLLLRKKRMTNKKTKEINN